MAKRMVEKLVRDKIIDHLKEQGKDVVYRQLTDDAEKKQKLTEKLGEKYKEMFETMARRDISQEKMADGIADMLEVLNNVAHLWNIELAFVMERKKQKIESKGGYDNWVYIEHVNE